MSEVELLVINVSKSKEYFCNGCGQLRLSVGCNPEKCNNCNGTDLIIGDLNSLNKDALKKEFKETQDG